MGGDLCLICDGFPLEVALKKHIYTGNLNLNEIII